MADTQTTPVPPETDLPARLGRSPRPAAFGMLIVAIGFIVAGVIMTIRSAQQEAAEVLTGISVQLLVALGLYALALTPLVGGLIALFAPPEPTRARIWARWMLLVLGAAFGLLVMVFGLTLSYWYQEFLLAWVNEGDTINAGYFLLTVFMGILGLGLMFTAVQTARPEERAHASLRLGIFVTNSITAGLLLILVLVVVNLVAQVRMPATIDTSKTGINTVPEGSRKFLAELKQPVNAYLLMSRNEANPIYYNTRQVLEAVEDAAGSKMFRVRYVDPLIEDEQIRELINRFPSIGAGGPGLSETNARGLLLSFGEDESVSTFIRDTDLVDIRVGRGEGEQTEYKFKGQEVIMGELIFLAQGRTKPVIYFLTGHGELEVSGFPNTPPERSGRRLHQFLEDRNYEIRPLKFDITAETEPRVPDDADVVVIAGPNRTIPEAEIEALRNYLAPEEGGRKKGKLFILFDTHTPLMATTEVESIGSAGLDSILEDFGIESEPRTLYGLFNNQITPFLPVQVSLQTTRAGNRIADAFFEGGRPYQLGPVRPVRPTTPPPDDVEPATLFQTYRNIPTWQEEGRIASMSTELIIRRLRNPATRREMNFSEDPVSVAVVVSERTEDDNTIHRLAVFGGCFGLTDENTSRRQGEPAEFRIFAATLDWLRDRPEVIDARPVDLELYSVDKDALSTKRLVALPLLIVLLTVPALGLGVWLMRRR